MLRGDIWQRAKLHTSIRIEFVCWFYSITYIESKNLSAPEIQCEKLDVDSTYGNVATHTHPHISKTFTIWSFLPLIAWIWYLHFEVEFGGKSHTKIVHAPHSARVLLIHWLQLGNDLQNIQTEFQAADARRKSVFFLLLRMRMINAKRQSEIQNEVLLTNKYFIRKQKWENIPLDKFSAAWIITQNMILTLYLI